MDRPRLIQYSKLKPRDRVEMWTIEAALPIVRSIARIAKPHGFSVALYGSVLIEGQSDNDLDLYFVPAEVRTSAPHAQACLDAITAKIPGAKCSPLTRLCTSQIHFEDGKRIDAQFLDATPLPDDLAG